MIPEEGSYQPKPSIKSGRSENPASRSCVEVPQPLHSLSSTCWKPSSPQSLGFPPHLPAFWGYWLLTQAPCVCASGARGRHPPPSISCSFPRLR